MKPTRLFDFLQYQLEQVPLDMALSTKYNGVWKPTTTSDFYKKSQAISRALLEFGIKPGSKIAMISSWTHACSKYFDTSDVRLRGWKDVRTKF